MLESERLVAWTDRVTGSYLVVTAALALLFRAQLSSWPLFVGAHAAGAALLWTLRWLPADAPRAVRFFRHWYPIILFPLLYKEVEVFAGAFGNWDLTSPIRALEVSLFAGHPSVYLAERWAWVPLSEYLHFSYFAYVVVIPGLAGYWYATRRDVAFRELVLLLSVTMFGSYLFFILYPVDSPFYLADPPGPPLAGHFFYELVHQLSSRGGARGGAFPSAHVSGAMIVWLVAWRHERRVAYLLAPVVIGVILATVYGGFHYVVDTVAGFAIAVLVLVGYQVVATRLREVIPDPSLS